MLGGVGPDIGSGCSRWRRNGTGKRCLRGHVVCGIGSHGAPGKSAERAGPEGVRVEVQWRAAQVRGQFTLLPRDAPLQLIEDALQDADVGGLSGGRGVGRAKRLG